MMPGMDGWAVLTVEAYRSIPIIVLTAQELTADDHRRLSGQVESIMQKGVRSGEELVREMRDLLKNSLPPQKAAR